MTEYYEIEGARVGGVVLEGGERLEADLVIAADGVKTRSTKLIAGTTIHPKDSGMATFRGAYARKHLTNASPLVKQQWPDRPGDHPDWQFWLGPGIHFLGMVTDDLVVWALTHQDDGTASESWTASVKPAEVIQYVEREVPGWHRAPLELMSTASTAPGKQKNWQEACSCSSGAAASLNFVDWSYDCAT